MRALFFNIILLSKDYPILCMATRRCTAPTSSLLQPRCVVAVEEVVGALGRSARSYALHVESACYSVASYPKKSLASHCRKSNGERIKGSNAFFFFCFQQAFLLPARWTDIGRLAKQCSSTPVANPADRCNPKTAEQQEKKEKFAMRLKKMR